MKKIHNKVINERGGWEWGEVYNPEAPDGSRTQFLVASSSVLFGQHAKQTANQPSRPGQLERNQIRSPQ